jgi:hypothetical protein
MTARFAMTGATALSALFALAAAQDAQAQTAPPPSTDPCVLAAAAPPSAPVPSQCTVVIPNPPQVQTAPVAATLTINGQTVTLSPAPPPGSPLPAEVTATSISGVTTALGNNLTYQNQNSLRLVGSTTQTLSGGVTATSTVTTTAAVPGLIQTTTTAIGNSVQGEVCCGGMDLTFNQTVLPATGQIAALSSVTTAPGLGTLSMAATASANVAGATATNGPLSMRSVQNNSAGIFSRAQGTVCCNTDSITLGSTAAANSSATNSETSTVYARTDQSNFGAVTSQSAHFTNSGRLITSATQATGNSATSYNRWGYTQLDGTQNNTGTINAAGSLQANNYLVSAVAGANATGNSVLLSSAGSDGTISFYQGNNAPGGILAESTLDAFSPTGGVGQAIAQATGNAMTAYACTSCSQNQVKVEGYFAQDNFSSVNANVTLTGGTGGALRGEATAVGNAATFIAQRSPTH